jgi:hypothetical protein
LVRHRNGQEYTTADGTTVKPVEHRVGWDATFSAPKSVSLTALVGGDELVREAHRQAVTTALTELERYTQARIGGNRAAETTGGSSPQNSSTTPRVPSMAMPRLNSTLTPSSSILPSERTALPALSSRRATSTASSSRQRCINLS